MRETLGPVEVAGIVDQSMHLGERPRDVRWRRGASVAAVVATVVCLATVVGATRFEIDRFHVPELRTSAATGLGLVGFALIVTALWVLRPHRPRAAVGLAVAASATIVPLWSSWLWLGPGGRAAALATVPFAVPGAALVVAGWTEVRRVDRRLLGPPALVATVAGVAHLLGYDPFRDPGCARTCERVSVVLGGVVSFRSIMFIVAGLTLVAAAMAFAIVWGERSAGAPAIVVAWALTVLSGLAVGSAVRVGAWGDPAWSVLLPLQAGLVASMAAAACFVEGRSWSTRRAVRRLVGRLSSPRAEIRDRRAGIADAHFAVPGSERWVDAAGRDVDVAPARSLLLRDGSNPVLRLVLSRGADESDVMAALTPAVRLALRNAQLSAVALARVADVRASQRRVAVAADAERRRIERDLHDAAQQRLIGIAFQLTIARSRVDEETAVTLRRVEDRVRDALAHLRDLAHGLFPRVLAEEGLEAALEELASDRSASLDVHLDRPIEHEAAMAAYATVAAALDRSVMVEAAPRVTVACVDEALVVDLDLVETDRSQVESDLVDVADRVGAIGGELTVSLDRDRLRVRAVIPCAS